MQQHLATTVHDLETRSNAELAIEKAIEAKEADTTNVNAEIREVEVHIRML